MSSYGSWMNSYDESRIAEIINDVEGVQYNWANAHVIRFLNKIMAKVDVDHQAALYRMYPDQMRAIYRYWGWSDNEILHRLEGIAYYNMREDRNTAVDLFPDFTKEL